MTEFLVSLVPSLGALFLLWVGLRAIFQADRRERAAMARFEAEYGRSPAPEYDRSPAQKGTSTPSSGTGPTS